MYKKRLFVTIILFLIPLNTNAIEKICDGSDINFNGTTLEEICIGGTILDSYIGLDSFTGEYLTMPLGYWGNKFSSNIQNPQFSEAPAGYMGTIRTNQYDENTIPKFGQVPIGFLGSNRTMYIPFQSFYTQPVGYLSLYKEQTLDFPSLPTPPADDTDYSMYPLIKPVTEEDDNQKGGGVSSSCNEPKRITEVSSVIKNNGLFDSLELSWEKKDTSKIKIIKVSPEAKTFYLEENKYTEVGLKEGTYSYFVVSYDDCSPGLYSDMVRIDYKEKKVTTIPYLTLDKNTLLLTLPDSTIPDPSSKFLLKCASGPKEIVNDFLSSDKTYKLDQGFLKSSFSCTASFFNTRGTQITSQRLFYNPFNKPTLTNKEALQTIYGLSEKDASLGTLYADLVTVEESIPSGSSATYGSTALILINSVLGVYAEDKDLATNVFTSLELYPSSIKTDEVISYEEFLNLYTFLVQDKEKYQQEVVAKVDDFFHPDEKFVTKKLLETYFLTEDLDALKNTDSAKYDILKKCFGLERCPSREIYQTEKKGVDEKVQELGNIFSGNDKDISYNDFIEILFKVLGSKEFVQEKYSIEEYNKFAEVLRVAITYGVEEEKFSYFSLYRNILSQIADEKLKPQVRYLTKRYLRNINKLYDSTKKEELLPILSDYLSN